MTIRASSRVGWKALWRGLPVCAALVVFGLGGCAPRAASADRAAATPSEKLGSIDDRAPPDGDAAAQAVALRFLDAAEQGDFVTAHSLLAAPQRARYSPETLARDFGRDPLSRARLARARQAVTGDARPERSSAEDGAIRYRIDERSAVRLVKEAGTLRVAAIE